MAFDPLNSYALQGLQNTLSLAENVLQPLNPSGIGATAPSYRGESAIAKQQANDGAVVVASALSGLTGNSASTAASVPTVVPEGNGLLGIG